MSDSKPMTWDESLAGCMALLGESFRRKDITPTTIRAYAIGLAGLSVEQMQAATHAAMRTCKFFPAPAELRELAGEAKPEDAAERAWAQFSAAIARHSVYQSLDFGDRIINAVVRSFGGLEVVAEYDGKEWEIFRARFLKAYAARRRTGVGDEEGAPLLGYCERVNQQPREPVRIAAPATTPRIDTPPVRRLVNQA